VFVCGNSRKDATSFVINVMEEFVSPAASMTNPRMNPALTAYAAKVYMFGGAYGGNE
jgi:hypothetical protein